MNGVMLSMLILPMLLVVSINASIKNCCDLVDSYPNKTPSGVYQISNEGAFTDTDVYCDMTTDGGGWIVIQRNRKNSATDFNRPWIYYKEGFGDLKNDFWAGLELMHSLTRKGKWELRVDYKFSDNTWSYIHYNHFTVGNSSTKYPVYIGLYTGIGGDLFSYMNTVPFDTVDRSNDYNSKYVNCAAMNSSGWWYTKCDATVTNVNNQPPFINGIVEFAEMKVRPKGCIINNCCELKSLSNNVPSGVYKMKDETLGTIDVYCDMTTGDGGWTVIQRNRNHTKLSFSRPWIQYQAGFGNLKEDFWAGLKLMHTLTNRGKWELRVDYRFSNNTWSYIHYKEFIVGSAAGRYTFHVEEYAGIGGDTYSYMNTVPFSTYDKENGFNGPGGSPSSNCAILFESGWWYTNCASVNVNNQPPQPTYVGDYILSSKFAEMKIRPKTCSIIIIEHCCDLLNLPKVKSSGLYTMKDAENLGVYYCDMTTDGGGWTVIQRNRENSNLRFYRSSIDYVDGFGNPNNDFWAGLQLMHELTSNGNWELRVDYQFSNKTWSYIHYSQFVVGSVSSGYSFIVRGYTGIGGDDYSYMNGYPFYNDRLRSSYYCARRYRSGWWYSNSRSCYLVNPNYRFPRPVYDARTVEYVEMKIRPSSCIIY